MQNSQFAEETSGTTAGGILLSLVILTLGIMADIIMVAITEVMAGIIKYKTRVGALLWFP